MCQSLSCPLELSRKYKGTCDDGDQLFDNLPKHKIKSSSKGDAHRTQEMLNTIPECFGHAKLTWSPSIHAKHPVSTCFFGPTHNPVTLSHSPPVL